MSEDGRLLYMTARRFEANAPVIWDDLPEERQRIWDEIAREFKYQTGLDLMQRQTQERETLQTLREWQDAFIRYARHWPGCAESTFFKTSCTCGFSETEKRLAA